MPNKKIILVSVSIVFVAIAFLAKHLNSNNEFSWSVEDKEILLNAYQGQDSKPLKSKTIRPGYTFFSNLKDVPPGILDMFPDDFVNEFEHSYVIGLTLREIGNQKYRISVIDDRGIIKHKFSKNVIDESNLGR